jgi:hypothetical protein
MIVSTHGPTSSAVGSSRVSGVYLAGISKRNPPLVPSPSGRGIA